MSEPLHETDATLPGWMVEALRAPVDPSGTRRGKAAVMAAVRRAPRHRHRPRALAPRWARRGVFAPAAALLAASVAVAFGLARPAGPSATPALAAVGPQMVTVLRDTIVPGVATLGGARMLDTLRVVRFALRAPAAAIVTLAGDFNAWSRTATPLVRVGRRGAWEATLLVPRDAVRYAFHVDGRALGAPTTLPGVPRAPGDSI